MSAGLWLVAAIASEIAATSALKLSDGFTRLVPSAVMVVGYAISFYGLALALRSFPLGIVYAIWSGVGTVGAVLVGRFVFGESLQWPQVLGIVAVIGGVVLMNISRKGVA